MNLNNKESAQRKRLKSDNEYQIDYSTWEDVEISAIEDFDFDYESLDLDFEGEVNKKLIITISDPNSKMEKKKRTVPTKKEWIILLISHRAILLGNLIILIKLDKLTKNQIIQSMLVSMLSTELVHVVLGINMGLKKLERYVIKVWTEFNALIHLSNKNGSSQFNSHTCLFCSEYLQNKNISNILESTKEPVSENNDWNEIFIKSIEEKESCPTIHTILFLAILKGLGIRCRLITSFKSPLSYKYFHCYWDSPYYCEFMEFYVQVFDWQNQLFFIPDLLPLNLRTDIRLNRIKPIMK